MLEKEMNDCSFGAYSSGHCLGFSPKFPFNESNTWCVQST